MPYYTGVENAYGCASLSNTPTEYSGVKRSCVSMYPIETIPDTSIWKVYPSNMYSPYTSMNDTYNKNKKKTY